MDVFVGKSHESLHGSKILGTKLVFGTSDPVYGKSAVDTPSKQDPSVAGGGVAGEGGVEGLPWVSRGLMFYQQPSGLSKTSNPN